MDMPRLIVGLLVILLLIELFNLPALLKHKVTKEMRPEVQRTNVNLRIKV
jgi:hypothetical protein